MQDSGAASESAVSEMQQLRDQMLAMQQELTLTQQKLQNYALTSLLGNQDAKTEKVDKHVIASDVMDNKKIDEMEDDRADAEIDDMAEDYDDMVTDDFTHAKPGKKTSSAQTIILASGKSEHKDSWEQWKKDRNALIEIENEIGTAAMTPDEIYQRLKLTKQINGLPLSMPCKEEMAKTTAVWFSNSTAEDCNDHGQIEKKSKFLANNCAPSSVFFLGSPGF